MPQNHQIHDGVLYINNVQPSDAGEYSCLGIGPTGTVLFTATARLVVIGELDLVSLFFWQCAVLWWYVRTHSLRSSGTFIFISNQTSPQQWMQPYIMKSHHLKWYLTLSQMICKIVGLTSQGAHHICILKRRHWATEKVRLQGWVIVMLSKLWLTYMKHGPWRVLCSSQKKMLENFPCSKHSHAVGDVSVIMYLIK